MFNDFSRTIEIASRFCQKLGGKERNDQFTMIPGDRDFCTRNDYLLLYCHPDGKKSRCVSENICDLPQLVTWLCRHRQILPDSSKIQARRCLWELC
jgi:hypothetical protein